MWSSSITSCLFIVDWLYLWPYSILYTPHCNSLLIDLSLWRQCYRWCLYSSVYMYNSTLSWEVLNCTFDIYHHLNFSSSRLKSDAWKHVYLLRSDICDVGVEWKFIIIIIIRFKHKRCIVHAKRCILRCDVWPNWIPNMLFIRVMYVI